MKCPHCGETLRLWDFTDKKWLLSRGDRSTEPEMCCFSCKKRLYWDISLILLFVGSVLALVGYHVLSFILAHIAFLSQFYIWVVQVYTVISIIAIGAYAVCMRTIPGSLSILEKSMAQRAYFWSLIYMIGSLLMLLNGIYINLIPSRDSLDHINDTIVRIENVGYINYYVLLNQGPSKRFVINADKDLLKKCPGIENVKVNSEVRILSELLPNLDGSYNIWGMVVDSRRVLSYEDMQGIKIRNADENNASNFKFAIIGLIIFLAALYFKRREDSNVLDKVKR